MPHPHVDPATRHTDQGRHRSPHYHLSTARHFSHIKIGQFYLGKGRANTHVPAKGCMCTYIFIRTRAEEKKEGTIPGCQRTTTYRCFQSSFPSPTLSRAERKSEKKMHARPRTANKNKKKQHQQRPLALFSEQQVTSALRKIASTGGGKIPGVPEASRGITPLL